MADIFISYKKEEKALAERLAKALEKRQISVWWDNDLIGGDRYRDVIRKQIDDATAVIVIWSPLSMGSGFILDEAAHAQTAEKLLPVTFEETIEPPMGFGIIQVQNLAQWNNKHNAPEIATIEAKLREIEKGNFQSALFSIKEQMLGGKSGTIAPSQFLSSLSVSVGGMPLKRFFIGSLGMSLGIVLPCFLVGLGSPDTLIPPESVFTYLFIFWVSAALIRAAHQYSLLASGKNSRRFFNQSFSFWVLVSLCCGILIAAGMLIYYSTQFDLRLLVQSSFVFGFGTLASLVSIPTIWKLGKYFAKT